MGSEKIEVNARKYKCECCQGEFLTDRPEDEALKEFEENFPNVPLEKTGVVCDDCYNEVMKKISN